MHPRPFLAFHHALVLHGTGMLRPVSLALSGPARLVSVVARSLPRLEELARDAAAAGGTIRPLIADTERAAAFVRSATERMEEAGPFDLVVAWGVAAATLQDLGGAIGRRGAWSLFHIRGSVAADPSDPLAGEMAELAALPGVTYHRIILGWAGAATAPRWLTDGEIAEGVLQAMASGAPEAIVGRVRPWGERPSW